MTARGRMMMVKKGVARQMTNRVPSTPSRHKSQERKDWGMASSIVKMSFINTYKKSVTIKNKKDHSHVIRISERYCCHFLLLSKCVFKCFKCQAIVYRLAFHLVTHSFSFYHQFPNPNLDKEWWCLNWKHSQSSLQGTPNELDYYFSAWML